MLATVYRTKQNPKLACVQPETSIFRYKVAYTTGKLI